MIGGTNDPELRRFAEAGSGAGVINGMVTSDARLLFAGIERSGYGRALGSIRQVSSKSPEGHVLL